jgi:hypothetical protein
MIIDFKIMAGKIEIDKLIDLKMIDNSHFKLF